MVTNVASGYRATVSHGERSVEWTGDRHARLVFRRDFMPPAFHAGVLRAGIAGMGARNPRVTGRQVGLLDAEFEVRWEGEGPGTRASAGSGRQGSPPDG